MKAYAQTPNWTQTVGTPFNDYGYSIEKTYDGGYIVSGTTCNDEDKKDILLLRLDAAGDTLWTRNIGSTHNDESYCVKQCRDSGFVIAGYKSNGSGNMDFYIIKTHNNGTINWTRTYGGTLNEGSYSIIQTMDDGFAVCGYTGSYGAGAKDMQLLKYDDDGYMMWQKTYGGNFDEIAYALLQTEDSGYFIAGTSKSFNNNTLNDVYCVRTNVQGDTLWTKDYQMEGNDFAYSVTATNGNYFLIAGKSNTATNQAMYQPLALKINQEGAIIFNETYNLGSDVTGCAYSVKEMPDLSYMLAGSITDPTNGQGSDVMILKIGEWGEAIDQQNYGTCNNEEARSFCIDDNENIVTVGKVFTSSTLNDLQIISAPICKVYYPRYIWINNVYNNANGAPADILGDAAATEDLADYLVFFKYSGIVITHFEDLYVDNATTYIQLRNFIKYLHLRGIPVVMGQYRTSENTLTAAVSKLKMDNFLNEFINYNVAAYTYSPFSVFDGLLLDYEFWQSDYGGAAINSFANINIGWENYQLLCADIIAARNNPANHLKYTAAWIGRILEPKEEDWDVDGDGIIGNNLDADDTHQAVMDKIDGYGFDRIVLAFFLTEKTNLSPAHFSQEPTSFLLRDGITTTSGAVNEPDWFMRLWYFSNNSVNTNIVPNFHAGYGNTTVSTNPKLVNFLLGQGYYTTPNYLADAENIFLSQFKDPAIFTNYSVGISPAWNSINLRQGFEWFRYEIGPMEVGSINSRPADAIHPFYNPCYIPNRISYQTNITYASQVNVNEIELHISPSPLKQAGTLKIDNIAPTQSITLQFTNAFGQNVTNIFRLLGTDMTHGDATVYFEVMQPISGVLLCHVYANGKLVGNTRFVTIK